VAFSIHALDGGNVGWCGIDLALIDVGTSDEESRLSTILLEKVENMVCVVLVWAIVECQGDGASLLTRINASSSIGDRADLGTGDSGCARASRAFVLSAARAKLVLATRRVAVVGSVATP
jgi:hypothetical protein